MPQTTSSFKALWRDRGATDLLVLAAINFMWALKWTTGKVALRDLDPVSITLYPMLASILLLVPFLRREVQSSRAYLGIIRKEALKPENLLRFFLLGAAGQVVVQVLTTWGVKYVSATDAAFIGLATPLLTAGLAVPIAGETVTWRVAGGFLFAVCGVLLMPGVNFHTGQLVQRGYLFGVLLLLAGGLGAAFYNAYSKKLLGQFYPVEILFYSYVFVILTLLPLHLGLKGAHAVERTPSVHWETWLSLAILALFVYGLSMILFLRLLTRRALAPVSVSFYLMTVFGALISTTVLHEPVSWDMVAGAVLVLAGALIGNVGKRHERLAA